LKRTAGNGDGSRHCRRRLGIHKDARLAGCHCSRRCVRALASHRNMHHESRHCALSPPVIAISSRHPQVMVIAPELMFMVGPIIVMIAPLPFDM
jgi:hypothetical protein